MLLAEPDTRAVIGLVDRVLPASHATGLVPALRARDHILFTAVNGGRARRSTSSTPVATATHLVTDLPWHTVGTHGAAVGSTEGSGLPVP